MPLCTITPSSSKRDGQSNRAAAAIHRGHANTTPVKESFEGFLKLSITVQYTGRERNELLTFNLYPYFVYTFTFPVSCALTCYILDKHFAGQLARVHNQKQTSSLRKVSHMLYSLHLLPTTGKREVAEDVRIVLVITCRFQVKTELGYSFINAKSVPNEFCMNANSHGHCFQKT